MDGTLSATADASRDAVARRRLETTRSRSPSRLSRVSRPHTRHIGPHLRSATHLAYNNQPLSTMESTQQLTCPSDPYTSCPCAHRAAGARWPRISTTPPTDPPTAGAGCDFRLAPFIGALPWRVRGQGRAAALNACQRCLRSTICAGAGGVRRTPTAAHQPPSAGEPASPSRDRSAYRRGARAQPHLRHGPHKARHVEWTNRVVVHADERVGHQLLSAGPLLRVLAKALQDEVAELG